MKTVKVVAAVIKALNQEGEPIIFATQRGYGEFKDGWEFPGGKVEEGETPQEALKREIMEELDTEITVGKLIDTIEYDYPTFHLSMDCFWCEVVKGELVLKEAEDMGYEFNVGPECEFFLFHTDDYGNPTTISHEKGSYFDLGPTDLGENARRDMVLNLEEMGFEVEASHHEVAVGQHEIDFKYDEVLRACDKIQIFKLVVKTIARKHGLYATFMAKPKFGIAGSGMHCNMSLFDAEGNNAFFDPNDPKGMQLSETAYYFLGGLIKHAYNYTAIMNPTVNSYKRLVPGYEAPVYIAWAGRNRSPLVRVPASRGMGTRLELRSVDPMANPYIAMAVLLEVGLNGIENKIEAPAPIEENIYIMTAEERKEAGITDLPSTLHNALKALTEDEVVKAALGEHIYTSFLEAKRIEWASYATFVSQWEIDNYLDLY